MGLPSLELVKPQRFQTFREGTPMPDWSEMWAPHLRGSQEMLFMEAQGDCTLHTKKGTFRPSAQHCKTSLHETTTKSRRFLSIGGRLCTAYGRG
jgi:hypothetical protein